jgi:hypothetical protein
LPLDTPYIFKDRAIAGTLLRLNIGHRHW